MMPFSRRTRRQTKRNDDPLADGLAAPSVRTSPHSPCVRRSCGSFVIDARSADMSGSAGTPIPRAAAPNVNKGLEKTANRRVRAAMVRTRLDVVTRWQSGQRLASVWFRARVGYNGRADQENR